jgi:hypothetical protein
MVGELVMEILWDSVDTNLNGQAIRHKNSGYTKAGDDFAEQRIVRRGELCVLRGQEKGNESPSCARVIDLD